MQLSGNYMADNNHLQFGDLTNWALTYPPDAPPVYNPDGSLNWATVPSGSSVVSTWTNPLSYLYTPYSIQTNNLIGNFLISYQILKGLDIKSSLGYTDLRTHEFQTTLTQGRKPESLPTSVRSATYSDGDINSWIVEPQITYKRTVGEGKLDILLGTTFQQQQSDREQLRGSGYNSDLVLEDIKSAATVTVDNSLSSLYKYNALFGRINYILREKYIVDLSARRDGSSRFGPESQVHDFESVAAGWIFSNEAFFRQRLPVISFGKLRVSYGTMGNDQIGDYRFLTLYTAVSATVPYGGISGLQPSGLPNPTLQWEENKKLQAGLDLGFFHDRIMLNVNYFRNRSSNQLLSYGLPIITGFANISAVNFPATVQNSGIELSLSTTNIKEKDFTWSTSFNLTVPKNKLVAFPNIGKSTYANQYIVGQPISSTKVFHYMGVDPLTGFFVTADANGNPTSSGNQTLDKTVIINTAPIFYGGLQNSFSYKGLELDFLVQFTKWWGNNYFFGNFPGQPQNQPASVWARWQKPGDITNVDRFFSSNINTILPALNVAAPASDAGVTDASYIRLKNASLYWTLPARWRKKATLENCRLFVQGQNLFTITRYLGLDPENRSSQSLPPLRVITCGINISL